MSGPSQRQQVRSALERIGDLEEQVPGIIMAVNGEITSFQRRVAKLAGVVEALVELFGAETVDAKVQEISDAKTLAQVASATKALEEGVKAGTLVPATAVTEKSLVVGKESDKDGKVVFPGRVQLPYVNISAPFQEKLLGNGVGTKFTTPTGNTFEVTEVYQMVEKAPEAAPTDSLDALEKRLGDKADAAPVDPTPVPAPTEAASAPAGS